MSVTPDKYLQLQGLLAQGASIAGYTRLHFRTGPQDRFVEFETAAAVFPIAPTGSLVNQLVTVFVPTTMPLFFSENPPPVAGGLLPNTGTTLHLHPAPPPTGLVFSDGSPATESTDAISGAPVGISGTLKDGTALSISIAVSNETLAGRLPKQMSNWAFCKAQVNVGALVAVTLGVSYSPADLLIAFFLDYKDVRSTIIVDVSPVEVSPVVAGNAILTRAITFFGEAICNETIPMPASVAGAGQYLATSSFMNASDEVDLFAPAITQIVGQLQTQTAPSLPVVALSALDIGDKETQVSFIGRGETFAGAALAALASEVCVSYVPGLCDLAQWLGWTLATVGKSVIESSFTSTYVAYQQWVARQGVGDHHGGWRKILVGGPPPDYTNQLPKPVVLPTHLF